MSHELALTLHPDPGRVQTRLQVLSAELLYAWDRTDSETARHWATTTARLFGRSLRRRAINLVKLAGELTTATVDETLSAVDAYKQNRLKQHLRKRAGEVYTSSADLLARVKVATERAAAVLRNQPREAVPQLLVLVATSLLVSGGPDGDGGAPDLDLMFGIGVHRSPFTHSILLGAALETGFLSLIELVKLLHARLPAQHDCMWDEMARQADSIARAASTGAGIGMSYHLFVDGLLQPAAYHGLPIEMPMWGHQAVILGNATAELVDVPNKTTRLDRDVQKRAGPIDDQNSSRATFTRKHRAVAEEVPFISTESNAPFAGL